LSTLALTTVTPAAAQLLPSKVQRSVAEPLVACTCGTSTRNTFPEPYLIVIVWVTWWVRLPAAS
jgi:hypothetical protein